MAYAAYKPAARTDVRSRLLLLRLPCSLLVLYRCSRLMLPSVFNRSVPGILHARTASGLASLGCTLYTNAMLQCFLCSLSAPFHVVFEPRAQVQHRSLLWLILSGLRVAAGERAETF